VRARREEPVRGRGVWGGWVRGEGGSGCARRGEVWGGGVKFHKLVCHCRCSSLRTL
jgi:hypothetical protein